jgi:predicted nucleic acid-binding protein
VSYVVLDTDVASGILRGRLSSALRTQLVGRTLTITFVTLGELTKWTLVRHWGPQKHAVLDQFLKQVTLLPYSRRVAERWGDLQAHAQLRRRPRPHNDTWIPACCLVRELPLATLNSKDFTDFADHEGLQLIG